MRRAIDGLWQVNLDAWRIYQALHGRLAGTCGLHGFLLDRVTATWAIEDVLDLVKRLDLMLDILDPVTRHGA